MYIWQMKNIGKLGKEIMVCLYSGACVTLCCVMLLCVGWVETMGFGWLDFKPWFVAIK